MNASPTREQIAEYRTIRKSVVNTLFRKQPDLDLILRYADFITPFMPPGRWPHIDYPDNIRQFVRNYRTDTAHDNTVIAKDALFWLKYSMREALKGHKELVIYGYGA